MHPDEVATDATLVRRLLRAQFPDWAGLPVARVRSAGTDNAVYRVGDTLAARLPRIPDAVAQVGKEQRWLPRLAPALPLAVPVPLAVGTAACGYPWPWSVYRWIEGDNATEAYVADPRAAGDALARFLVALRGVAATGGPAPGRHNFLRGAPLAVRDAETRDAIASLSGRLDTGEATHAWEAALAAPAWDRPPVWVHGDLPAGNLLVRDGRLAAVIDFGCLGVGDPACDVMAAWTYLPADGRDAFRTAVQVDGATWARGRGWALSFGLVALPYYQATNPVLAGIARRAVDAALADFRRTG